MSYSVIWEADAIASLARIWLVGPDRPSITAAQATIDHLLSMDPTGRGSHVSGGLWAIEIYPLRALYEIHEAERSVLLTALRKLS